MTRFWPRTSLALSTALAAVSPAMAASDHLVVIANGEQVGALDADQDGNTVTIHYDVKDNGRGPTIDERIVLDDRGLPQSWNVDGTGLFGNEVAERFTIQGNQASWQDATGSQTRTLDDPMLYISQDGSPWSLGLYARALLADADHRIEALPGGELALEEMEPVTLGKGADAERFNAYLIKGLGLTPSMILLDSDGRFFSTLSPFGAVIRKGYEDAVPKLTALATERTSERFETIQSAVAHHYDTPVRIRNVRIFDPVSKSLGDPVSLVFFEDSIASIEPLDSPATPGEVLVEGDGRTVLPGLHDMHAHLSLQSSLLYIASGVTSVRDMGNDNRFLLDLQRRIRAGEVAGPRIVRNGFLEGRSDYSARTGIVVDSEEAAVDAVRWYAARGYWQIKIYNSMNPDWVPAITREAKKLGLGVTGHIPAFTNADNMIAAGYDEITHANQLMLGWVLAPDEDTRTPLRLTAMRRMATLDLDAPRVAKTLDTMVTKDIALDPTAVTLELLMLSHDGMASPAVADYIDHLPVGLQRRRHQGIASFEGPEDYARYVGGFDTVKKLLKRMHDRGLTLLPGTDDQTGLSVHRELQIYAEAGIPRGDVLAIGTLGPEIYMGRDQRLGTVEKGKLADFILIDGNPLEDMSDLHKIAMVVKGGTVYFPSDIWDAVGVQPFAAPPAITLPETTDDEPVEMPHSHDVAEEYLY
ncbi:amidohydrolase family protein [Altericroceibacterium endophyticum]|uniref:Amidohydrolase family protein n=1 Tax=Altericroceibacterium endophyticum TaxID=1808508 RepID=A0A6I4T4F1_9SPHN|nr:amidohydrolase family protein [Altericroceibacterium endophyticum]MXO66174.1 amidohydrolase family protein [Altericroceibacterium endophyticum]